MIRGNRVITFAAVVLTAAFLFSCSSGGDGVTEITSSSYQYQSSSSQYQSSSSVWNGETFTDPRDGNVYRIKNIGDGDIWFLQNLALNGKTYFHWNEVTEACPSGWHLPSDAEWENLNRIWFSNGNKEDFTAIDDYKVWLDASSYPDEYSNLYVWTIDGDNLYKDNKNKDLIFSVRCVTNVITREPLTDARDNNTYKIVKIGTQIWMAENLKYNADRSKCYDDEVNNCELYGRLYDWATAMDINISFNDSKWDGSDIRHQGVCPLGWHLPSEAEWVELMDFAGGWKVAGKKFKAKSGWNETYIGGVYYGNGTDDYGFSALPSRNGSIIEWLSTTEGSSDSICNGTFCSCDGAFCLAYTMQIASYSNYALPFPNEKSDLNSIRCVKD